MKITHLGIDDFNNLVIKGINEKGREEKTYIAIPPGTKEPRVDIISVEEINEGYNYGMEEKVIVIKVTEYGNEVMWSPGEICGDI